MPRAVESKEAAILRWFTTAPLAAATLLLGLCRTAVETRKPKGRRPGTHPALAPPKVTAPKAKPAAAKKKSHHKAKPKAAAAVESFALPSTH